MPDKGPSPIQRQKQSEQQRFRNRNTVKVVQIKNAFLVTDGDTGDTCSYHTLDDVTAHLQDFFGGFGGAEEDYPEDMFNTPDHNHAVSSHVGRR